MRESELVKDEKLREMIGRIAGGDAMKRALPLLVLLGVVSSAYAGVETGFKWVSYVDEDYGFKVEYPASWSVQVLLVNDNKAETVVKKKIAFRSAEEPAIILDLWTNDLNQDVLTWFARTQRGMVSEECVIPETANVTVDGESALSLYNPQRQSSDQRITYFRSGNLLFKAEYRVTDADQSLHIYEHLLRSFSRTAAIKELSHD